MSLPSFLITNDSEPHMAQSTRIGFIGLGYMGHGMAANILARGFPLAVVAHRKRGAVDDLVGKGAREATSVRELAAASDVILLCVTGPEQVDDLVRRSDGIAAGAVKGTTVIDCTTSAPATLLSLARDFPELVFVDAPLGRSPKEAWAGKLAVVVGCTHQVLTRIRPVLSAFADEILHAGPPGSGHALKLVNNVISLGYAALYSEALLLAHKAGVSSETFDRLVTTSRMNCDFYQTFMGWVRRGDASTHRFALGIGEHTIADAARLARDLELDLRALPAVREVYARAVTDGFADAYLPELPRSVAKANCVDLHPAAAAGRESDTS